jgi:protein MBA1
MSTQIPLRIARSSLNRQCLFQRRTPSTPRSVAAPPTRVFSSTPQRPRRKENRLVDIRMQIAGAEATVLGQPAPNVQTNNTRDVQEMAEDIGLLQNTVVRASLSKLPSPASWEFYSYFWTVLKSRFTGLYTRSHFKRCVVKKGIKSYLPVDFLQQGMLKSRAKKFYKRYYESLAAYVFPVSLLLFSFNISYWRERKRQSQTNTPQRRRQSPPQHLPPAPRRLAAQPDRRPRPRENVLAPA